MGFILHRRNDWFRLSSCLARLGSVRRTEAFNLSGSVERGCTLRAQIIFTPCPRCSSLSMRLNTQAFAYNFLSAMSAVAGTIVIMALSDTLNDAQISIILLVGAGAFIFIALSELLPDALSVVPGASKRRGGGGVMCSQLHKLSSFVLGALLIGIPLIFDEHCGSGHDHDH